MKIILPHLFSMTTVRCFFSLENQSKSLHLSRANIPRTLIVIVVTKVRWRKKGILNLFPVAILIDSPDTSSIASGTIAITITFLFQLEERSIQVILLHNETSALLVRRGPPVDGP